VAAPFIPQIRQSVRVKSAWISMGAAVMVVFTGVVAWCYCSSLHRPQRSRITTSTAFERTNYANPGGIQDEHNQNQRIIDPSPNQRPSTPTGVIARLEVDHQTVRRGRFVTLHWSAENATRVVLQPGIGVVESRGSRTVPVQQSTTYRLVADGVGGQRGAMVHVAVIAPPPSARLTALPSTVQRGQPITLNWTSEHAEEVTLEPEVGRVGTVGSFRIYPTASGIYQLAVRGEGGEAQAQVQVTVEDSTRVITAPAGTQRRTSVADSLSASVEPKPQPRRNVELPLEHELEKLRDYAKDIADALSRIDEQSSNPALLEKKLARQKALSSPIRP